MDVDWGPWTVLAEIASRNDPGPFVQTQYHSSSGPQKVGSHGHVTHARLLHPCQALWVQIGMPWRIRVDNLFRAILRHLEHSDRFVRS
jgi:hypothetical protein